MTDNTFSPAVWEMLARFNEKFNRGKVSEAPPSLLDWTPIPGGKRLGNMTGEEVGRLGALLTEAAERAQAEEAPDPGDIRLTPPAQPRILEPAEVREVHRALSCRMEDILRRADLKHSSGHEVDIPALAEDLHDAMFGKVAA